MATIKSYTSLEQSKKLAEILPLESADAIYEYYGAKLETSTLIEKPIYWLIIKGFESCCRFSTSKKDIPCWSLAVLINILPKSGKYEPFIDIRYNRIEYHAVDDEIKDKDYLLCYVDGCSLLDACYEMILKLYELNLL